MGESWYSVALTGSTVDRLGGTSAWALQDLMSPQGKKLAGYGLGSEMSDELADDPDDVLHSQLRVALRGKGARFSVDDISTESPTSTSTRSRKSVPRLLLLDPLITRPANVMALDGNFRTRDLRVSTGFRCSQQQQYPPGPRRPKSAGVSDSSWQQGSKSTQAATSERPVWRRHHRDRLQNVL